MNRFSPSPALRLFRSHACVIEPALIEEVAVTIGTTGPCCRGNRVDDGGKIALALVQRLLRTVVLGDVDDRAHELHELARLAKHRATYSVNVPYTVSRMNDAVVQFEVCFLAHKLFEPLTHLSSVVRMDTQQEFCKFWKR